MRTPLELVERLVASLGIPRTLLDELQRLHQRQWALEDQTRAPGRRAAEIASAKHTIDASNSRRHQLIDAIDAAVPSTCTNGARRLYSETVGELCDRLLIFDLKYRSLPDPSLIHGVCEHLAIVVDQLINDLATGRAALPPRAGVKIYNGVPS